MTRKTSLALGVLRWSTHSAEAIFSVWDMERCVLMHWVHMGPVTVQASKDKQNLHSLSHIGRLPQETFGRSYLARNPWFVSSKEPGN